MGRLIYDGRGAAIDIDDRTLAHLRLAIATKLRRGEAFMLDVDLHDGTGRRTLWLHPSLPLQFHFFSPRRQPIDREWVEELIVQAGEPDGMKLLTHRPETQSAVTEAVG